MSVIYVYLLYKTIFAKNVILLSLAKMFQSKKDNWRRDKILTMKFSSNFDNENSETERKKWEKKQEKIVNKSRENK